MGFKNRWFIYLPRDIQEPPVGSGSERLGVLCLCLRASSRRRGREESGDGGGDRDGDAPVGAAATQGRAAGCAVLRGGARFQRKRLLREKGLIPSPSVIDSTFAAKQKHALLRLGAPRLITIRLLASKSGF